MTHTWKRYILALCTTAMLFGGVVHAANDFEFERSLKDFKITKKPACGWHFNKSCLLDDRSMPMEFTFKNQDGKSAKATFNCQFRSWGNTFSLCARTYMAFIVGSELSLEDAQNGELHLEGGVFCDSLLGTPLFWHKVFQGKRIYKEHKDRLDNMPCEILTINPFFKLTTITHDEDRQFVKEQFGYGAQNYPNAKNLLFGNNLESSAIAANTTGTQLLTTITDFGVHAIKIREGGWLIILSPHFGFSAPLSTFLCPFLPNCGIVSKGSLKLIGKPVIENDDTVETTDSTSIFDDLDDNDDDSKENYDNESSEIAEETTETL